MVEKNKLTANERSIIQLQILLEILLFGNLIFLTSFYHDLFYSVYWFSKVADACKKDYWSTTVVTISVISLKRFKIVTEICFHLRIQCLQASKIVLTLPPYTYTDACTHIYIYIYTYIYIYIYIYILFIVYGINVK